MSKYLLDTNAYSALMAGDRRIANRVGDSQDVVYLSVFVLGELRAGFRGGNRFESNWEILMRFSGKPTVRILEAGLETSEIFGDIKDSLKTAGTPIPINDVWIASHSIETGSTLVTLDGHFRQVPGLRIWPS